MPCYRKMLQETQPVAIACTEMPLERLMSNLRNWCFWSLHACMNNRYNELATVLLWTCARKASRARSGYISMNIIIGFTTAFRVKASPKSPSDDTTAGRRAP